MLATLPSGWRNVASVAQRLRFGAGQQTVEVGYRFGSDGLRATVDGDRSPSGC